MADDLDQRLGLPVDYRMQFVYPLLTTSPSLLAAQGIVLISMLRYLNRKPADSTALLRLRGFAIQSIQSALDDQTQHTSDVVITAVSLMATFEGLFGNDEHYRLNMQGLAQIVRLRGGSPALGYGPEVLESATVRRYESRARSLRVLDPPSEGEVGSSRSNRQTRGLSRAYSPPAPESLESEQERVEALESALVRMWSD